jgi:two-component system chemotaxis response regulator CheY
MRALVVDDSAVIRRFLKHVLEPEGIEVAEAVDGIQALKVLQDGAPIDFAFLDWRLPGMDGYEVLNLIRSDTKFDHTQILMVSTETDEHLIQDALKAGADEYIIKPFTRDFIVETVHNLQLKQRRGQA